MIGSKPVSMCDVCIYSSTRQPDKQTIIEPADCRPRLKAGGSGCEQGSPVALSPLKG